jgi:hypothetical protein
MNHNPNNVSVERDTFANNRLSVQLLASNPLYSLGLHMSAYGSIHC